MTTGGLLLLTFTPLSGLSDVVMMFLPGGDIREQADEKSGRFVVMATWDDVPHLDERTKEMLFASYMPFQRDARTRGVPALGSGAIYPVPESDIVVPDFALAEHWPRCYGMDVGWNRTAAIWGALDRETGTTYLYSQHYRGEAEPIVHAQAIKNRGEWIPGAIDPASRGRSQNDGQQLMDLYCGMGLDLAPADNAVESGIYDTWTLLSAGKLKVFASCQDWINEYRIYSRDDKGQGREEARSLNGRISLSRAHRPRPGAMQTGQKAMTTRTTGAADGWAKHARSASRRGKSHCRRERGNFPAHPVKECLKCAASTCPRNNRKGWPRKCVDAQTLRRC
jgi:hypothetical protein